MNKYYEEYLMMSREEKLSLLIDMARGENTSEERQIISQAIRKAIYEEKRPSIELLIERSRRW